MSTGGHCDPSVVQVSLSTGPPRQVPSWSTSSPLLNVLMERERFPCSTGTEAGSLVTLPLC